MYLSDHQESQTTCKGQLTRTICPSKEGTDPSTCIKNFSPLKHIYQSSPNTSKESPALLRSTLPKSQLWNTTPSDRQE